jgi:glycine cleavage system T protein
MTELVQQTQRTSPLDDMHRRHGATMTERDGWSLPASFGDTMAEYSAVRDGGGGVIDLSSRGRVIVEGSEAVQFLNGLVTNDVNTLSPNSWMPAVFPNVQGRLLAAVRVIHHNDGFLIDTESVTHETVVKLLERFTLAGDFRVTDLSRETAQISVQGARAPEIVRTALGKEAGEVERQHATEAKLPSGRDVTVIRGTHTAEDGFDLFCRVDDAEALWRGLLAAGARPVGSDAFEIMRIEAGVPRYGVDMDQTTVVTETNLDDAVSFTKGCYVGQEIIVRIKHRGHVAKKLTGLVLDGRDVIDAGAKIRSTDGKEIGRVTSSTFSPRRQRTIALGYVKYDYLAPETRVKVVSGGDEHAAQVASLPFVRGSWYGIEVTGDR